MSKARAAEYNGCAFASLMSGGCKRVDIAHYFDRASIRKRSRMAL